MSWGFSGESWEKSCALQHAFKFPQITRFPFPNQVRFIACPPLSPFFSPRSLPEPLLDLMHVLPRILDHFWCQNGAKMGAKTFKNLSKKVA